MAGKRDDVTRDWHLLRKLELELMKKQGPDLTENLRVMDAMEEDSGIRIDFMFSFSHYAKQALERATVVTIRDTPVNFASLEDVVTHMIIAGRPRDIRARFCGIARLGCQMVKAPNLQALAKRCGRVVSLLPERRIEGTGNVH